MITVEIRKSNGEYAGFSSKGHAGYAESGNDILCAALSAMTMLILNTIEVSYASDVEYTINEGTADITVKALCALEESGSDENKRYAVAGLFMGYYYQLCDLTEEYYDYLEVEIQDD